MEETENATNQSKRLKPDRIKPILKSHFLKRNYDGSATPQNHTIADFVRYRCALSKVSQPKLLYFACWNNKDALVIENNFCKFTNWLKDIGPTELENLVAPLFCYMYLELRKRGMMEYASTFFAKYSDTLDLKKCDDSVSELIATIANGFDANGAQDIFGSNKYSVQISSKACWLLKSFLASCHIVFLQMLTLWLEIEEVSSDDEDEEDEDSKSSRKKIKLEKIRALAKKHSADDLFAVKLNEVDENVTYGLIDGYNGTVVYSHSNAAHIRSIGTMRKQLKRERCEKITMRHHSQPITDIAIVKRHNLLATASLDHTVCLFDLNNHTKHNVLQGHTYPVYSLACSNDGNYLISGSYDATIRLWSLNTNTTVRLYAGHKHEITNLDFHPNSLYFASASADRVVRMWTTATPTPVRLFYGSEGPIYSAKFSPNGRLIACASEDKLRVWDLASSKQLLEIKCGTKPVTRVCWSADQSSLATGSIDGVVQKWDISKLLANPAQAEHCKPIACAKLESRLLNLDYSNGIFYCLTIKRK